jgi:cupin fold WbuC family metalloprotein
MTAVRVASDEVLVAEGGVVRVTSADLAEVARRGLRSPRKRARLCTHPTSADPLHEMMICLARGTYVRPHRHAGKSESFHVIDGELSVVLFHDDGRVREAIDMAPYRSGRPFFYRLAEPAFHTVLVSTPVVLLHETTNGPFDPADTEFAPWAPAEGDPAAAEFLNSLRTRTVA